MTACIADVRDSFVNPPMTARPLWIIHGFNGLLKRSTTVPPEVNWLPSADLDDLHDNLLDGLRRIRDWGFGGVVANVGWTNYLEDEAEWRLFLQGIRVCKELGLRVWIYDELGYPSGSAGGLVLRGHPEFEAEVLVRTSVNAGEGQVEVRAPSRWRRCIRAVARTQSGEVELTDTIDSNGSLKWEAPAPCTIERYDVRTAFEGTHCTGNVHAIRKYINVLDPGAVRRFYDVTYGQYIQRLGTDVGIVEAFFTDEPSFMTEYFPAPPERIREHIRVDDIPLENWDRLPQLPWRSDMMERFYERWGYDLRPHLGSLYAGDNDSDLRVRHDFHQLASELYARTFFGGLQDGLRPCGIALSGHVLVEESIIQHVASEGSVMMNLEEMDKPGIDMLTSVPEKILDTPFMLTCKYGSSSAHVAGRWDVMTEASDWIEKMSGEATTVEQRRGALGVQAALGITTLCSYYGWQGFEPEEVHSLTDFWGRVSEAVRTGVHVAPAAVLYPIRTAWAYYLPSTLTSGSTEQPEPLASLDEAIFKIGRTLLGMQIDLDFVDSKSLTSAEVENGRLQVANETYEMLVVPPGAVLCPDDMSAIWRYVESGGRVLAFEPFSDVRLQKASRSADGMDRDESAREFLFRLHDEYPESVGIFELGGEWHEFVRKNIHCEIELTGNTARVLVRQTRLADGDVFLVVNASREPTSVGVSLASADMAEVWNPADGTMHSLGSQLEIEGYGARIIVCEKA